MQEIVLYSLEKIIAGILPGCIGRRLFHVEKNVEIEFVPDKDDLLSGLNRQVPFLCLNFKITNFNPFTITLDRLLLEVWFGQPTLHGAILKRCDILPRKPGQVIYFNCAVTDAQKQQIERFLSSDGGGQLHICYTAYFESKMGWTRKGDTITRSRL
jgi:hypothetical protein